MTIFMLHTKQRLLQRKRAAKQEQADPYEYDDILHRPGPSFGARHKIIISQEQDDTIKDTYIEKKQQTDITEMLVRQQ